MEKYINKCQVFPVNVVDDVTEVEYPRFRRVASHCIRAFIPYLSSQKTVRFIRREVGKKVLEHIGYVGKESMTFQGFKNCAIELDHAAKGLKKDVNPGSKQDYRLSFKTGSNAFLVKHNFTFGQKTVAPGTEHIYQVMAVPLVFYLKRIPTTKDLGDGGFERKEIALNYDRYILLAHSRYRVPEGATYVILTPQTFFGFDVVRAGMWLPFAIRNPLMEKTRKLPDI